MLQYISDGVLNYYFHIGIELACSGYADEYNKPEEVYIPDKVGKYRVTMISGGAFQGEKNLRKIKFTNSIHHIAAGAFQNCPNLEIVSIENSGYGWNPLRFAKFAFRDCPKLKVISGYGRDVYLETRSITECESLHAFPVKVVKIEGMAVAHCPELHDMEFAQNAELCDGALEQSHIKQLCFDGNIVYPEGITKWLPNHVKIHCLPNSNLVDLTYFGYSVETEL